MLLGRSLQLNQAVSGKEKEMLTLLGEVVLLIPHVICLILQILAPANGWIRRWIIITFVIAEKLANKSCDKIPFRVGCIFVLMLLPAYWILFESDSNDFWHDLLHWDWCSPNKAMRSNLIGRPRLFERGEGLF
ncbi:MAG: hypothetical protein Q7R89_03280 [bacterium]|nr:hypothetical protein [bacterium]